MHKIVTSIREIPLAEIAGRSEQDLLNAGIAHISGDLYSCVEQHERTPELVWAPTDRPLPGVPLSEGLLKERHAKLPLEVRDSVMRASVIQSSDPAFLADDLALAALILAAAEADRLVGKVDGESLIDVSDPKLLVGEAQRLLSLSDTTLVRKAVSMESVAAGDVIEAENLIPHSWSGEPKR